MTPSLQEQATINFYSWESRGRGYILNDSPIDIEPPYIPFSPVSVLSKYDYDDGRVPSLFSQALKLLQKPKKQEINVDKILPIPQGRSSERVVYSLFFPKENEIHPPHILEVLHLLCYGEDVFSFEILAQRGNIQVLFSASEVDSLRLQSQLKAYFPKVILKTIPWDDINFDFDEPIAIADFGLENEFMLPTESSQNFSIDPLTSIIGTMAQLEEDETALFQVLFKGVTAPWAHDAIYASGDGKGGSFFESYPDFIKGVKTKVSSPLFATIMRIAVQGKNEDTSRYIASELARNISSVSSSEYNRLIPLSNEGYDFDEHLKNVYYRSSNRLGFILNSHELAHFVHYPNKTVICTKLGLGNEKTKRLENVKTSGIYLGENTHNGESYPVHLGTESRLSHVHILGATGTGKSTLMAQMILQDIKNGLGCALFDPHGDICEDILHRISEHRKDDVVLIDPSDLAYPIGFNLLEAKTEAEKIVLSSDIVQSFKRHATAWGDNMTAVLQNVVSTILESTRGGTLIELKRFLLEERYREHYLKSVNDPSLHYYWINEYPLVRKGIAPLLTRIDTFLRPKTIRYMLAQRSGVDIAECLAKNKVVLLKLPQGLIGEQNAYLLGSLFLAKFNQAALGRQSLERHNRRPYMLYLDEFQNFITPSIERILSGARKYGLGITLAHQELQQIEDVKLLNSVLSNPKTRICFRLGDSDAKRLDSGFSYFDQNDLQSLERGQAIMRIGSSKNDFNLQTKVLDEVGINYKNYIISRSRELYGTPKDTVEEILVSLLPQSEEPKKNPLSKAKEKEIVDIPDTLQIEDEVNENPEPKTTLEEEKEKILLQEEVKERESKHKAIANYVHTLGQQRNFITHKEYQTKNGGRIDVVLKREAISIGIEISVTNTIDYEIKNLKKCLNEDMNHVYLISESKIHLRNIKKRAKETFEKELLKKIGFGTPAEFLTFLGRFDAKPKKQVKRVRGYRVKSSFKDIGNSDAEIRNQKIQDIILKAKDKKDQ